MVGKGFASFPAVSLFLFGSGSLATGMTAPAFTVDEILANPRALTYWTPDAVEAEIGTTPGWRVETLGKGTHQGQGWMFREYLANGEASGTYIEYHPGGGRHGANPYWRVRQPNVPSFRVPGGTQ